MRENGEEERKKLQWVRGRDGARGKTEGGKMEALMIYEMGREIRAVGGTREGNLNDLNKA